MSKTFRVEWVDWVAFKCFPFLGMQYGRKCVIELLELYGRQAHYKMS